ncbi:MAG: LptF/LptG family permease [Parachlamydiales bacterium]|nr:LptF/LptG family permease [Parachlamydiales bacterium]
MTLIWQRYYLKEAFKVFSLLLFSFYFLYMLIDYAFHAQVFTNKHFPLSTIGQYYLCHISKRAYILLPFALMISTLKVLTGCNQSKELVALMAGGISIRKILTPFVLFALACTTILYINTQWIQPQAVARLEVIEEAFFNKGLTSKNASHVNALTLLDDSHLIYQHYDSAKHSFNDIFWIKTSNDIYRMKTLYIDLNSKEIPVGKYVDHLQRNGAGEFVVSETFQTQEFPNIEFEEMSLQTVLIPPREQSLTQLITSYYKAKRHQHHSSGEIIGVLNYKIALPLICLLAVIATGPYCMRYDRNFPLFSIYAISIIGFVIFYMIMHSSCVLAENDVAPPFFTIWLPLLALLIPFSYKAFLKRN